MTLMFELEQLIIREITSGIPKIRNLGLRRLTSFGMTVGGIPLAVVQTGKALNNVTEENIFSKVFETEEVTQKVFI